MRKIFSLMLLVVAVILCGGTGDAETIHFERTDIKGPRLAPVKIKSGVGLGNAIIDDTNNPDKKIVFTKAAGDEINWDAAPRFNNEVDLVKYIRAKKILPEDTLPVVLTDGYKFDFQSVIENSACWAMSFGEYGGDEQTAYIVFTLTITPGERVLYAYKHNDKTFLDEDELKLYDAAVKIVNEAKNFSKAHKTSPLLYRELYIHNAITDRADYYTENPQPMCSRFQTAVGAILDGKANCQGFTDAFYMLANMCDLNADKITGDAGGGHVWNTVNFGDDKYYFMDVTWDDSSFVVNNHKYDTYIYFNVPTNIISTTHKWPGVYVHETIQNPDGRYFYYTQEFSNSGGEFFGNHSNSAREALQYIAQRIGRDGKTLSWACTPYDESLSTLDGAGNYLSSCLQDNYNWSGDLKMDISVMGNYMYFTVGVEPKSVT